MYIVRINVNSDLINVGALTYVYVLFGAQPTIASPSVL